MNEFFRSYLDTPVSRYGTSCRKWDSHHSLYGCDDIIPAGIADMDFCTAPAVRHALIERVQHGIYGYTDKESECKTAEINWMRRRYGFDCKSEWILHSNSVVGSLFTCLRTLTKPGDKVLIQPPVYPPFFSAVTQMKRRLILSPLLVDDSGYSMDFSHIESQFAKGVRMMLLCNPHNPIGRIWTQNELQHLLALAKRFHVIIVSDEIHSGIILDSEFPHTCLLSLNDSDRCIMLTSVSKSFNLSGLQQASIIIKNPDIHQRIAHQLCTAHSDSLNLFSAVALHAAYTEGDEWLDAVCEYIRENRDYVSSYIRKHIPSITCHIPQGTYLMWLDFSGLHRPHQEIADFLVQDARIALTDGQGFGVQGNQHFRLNIATPQRNITEILERIRIGLENKVWTNAIESISSKQIHNQHYGTSIRVFLQKHIPIHSLWIRLWRLLQKDRTNRL